MRVAPPAPASGPDIEMPGRRTDMRRMFNMAPPIPVSGPTIEIRREEPKPPQPAPDDDEEEGEEGDEPRPQPGPTPPEPNPQRRTAQELITAAQGATTRAELDAIQAEAQGRTSVLSAIAERRRQI